jgi:hypothetical protein
MDRTSIYVVDHYQYERLKDARPTLELDADVLFMDVDGQPLLVPTGSYGLFAHQLFDWPQVSNIQPGRKGNLMHLLLELLCTSWGMDRQELLSQIEIKRDLDPRVQVEVGKDGVYSAKLFAYRLQKHPSPEKSDI